MKKRLLLITLLLSISNLYSQITLTAADFANGGDTVRMSQATDNGYDYTATGQGYTWDFSSLVAISQSLKDFRSMANAPSFVQFVFGTFAPVKYQATYYIESTTLPIDQISSFLPVSIENLYQYSKNVTDSLTSLGYGMTVSGNDIPFKSDTIETRYDFPVNNGNTHFSRGYTMIDFNPILDAKWNQHRTRASEVDGYGSITTPYGTFDVLRIRHDITEIDSLYYTFPFVGAIWVPIPVPASHEYEWWTNNEKEPILRITTNEIGGNEIVTNIEYRDIYLGLDAGLEETSINFKVFPNPVAKELTISGIEKVTYLQIFDQNGALLESVRLNGEESTVINVSKYSKGMYQIHLQAGASKIVKTFVKQ